MHALGFVLLPEFSHLGLAAAIEPLFVANWLAQRPLYAWHTVSVDGSPVRASNGARIAVDGDLAAASGCATVFVLASFEPAQGARDRRLSRWLQRRARAGTELGGIENGSQALAEAGLLDERRAAVHWDNLPGFQELYPAVEAVPELYCFSRGRITCAGAAAILDMMLAFIRRADEALAREVARHLLIDPVRGPSGAARGPNAGSSAADGLVARARTLMRERLDEPLSCALIARRVGLSLRQLERRFTRECGHSVHREYLLLRLEKAHQFLQQTRMSVTEVAVACGFGSAEYLARVYQRTFGCPPGSDRRQSTTAPVFGPRTRGTPAR